VFFASHSCFYPSSNFTSNFTGAKAADDDQIPMIQPTLWRHVRDSHTSLVPPSYKPTTDLLPPEDSQATFLFPPHPRSPRLAPEATSLLSFSFSSFQLFSFYPLPPLQQSREAKPFTRSASTRNLLLSSFASPRLRVSPHQPLRPPTSTLFPLLTSHFSLLTSHSAPPPLPATIA
jgi:hypothetical protein